ncbi:MAG: hypothetical protein WBG18_12025 [Xanthobacteraceae bacterium]
MATLRNAPGLDWFLGAALAGVIGVSLLSYQWARPAVKALPAPPEMMQLLQDEHRLIAHMIELRIASEKMLAYGEGRN